jgi:dolichyl-phosphate beta-glucosyltransferase
MSVVIPAYNEEERLEIMLEEAVTFLDAEYGREAGHQKRKASEGAAANATGVSGGYEILIVNDGSKDRTVDVALAFSRRHSLHDILRICTLKENRGKGGAVTHGFRHVRGAYAIFADADGASKFEDLAKLVEGCNEVADEPNRGIAVGSRAHLVGSEAVVKVRFTKREVLIYS